MQEKYCLDFILRAYGSTPQTIKNALSEFGEHLEITEDAEGQGEARDFKIRILTEEPTLVFDVCSQFGRIKSVKINEERGL
jgi:dihydroxyacetone kinase-like predicted kinase